MMEDDPGASLLLMSKKQSMESEDSSYDSDCEVSDGTHYDVSRTVSDTLGQEFEEYVTSGSVNGSSERTLDSLSRSFSQDLRIEDPLYQSRVDFARKLGYSEEQVKMALSKLGQSPSQNELLAELIQLDCTGSGSASSIDESDSAGPSPSSLSPPTPTPIVLRHIVIDGPNLAMSHGNNKTFSCRGIQLAVDYFKQRGHKEITVFVPTYRKETPKIQDPLTDQHILIELEKDGYLVFTPSRTVGNKRLVCYDDRYVLKLAVETDGIVVSNDNYRDLTIESPEYKRVISERMLMYSFVNDRFMPPEDPLGRNGPSLDQFLSKTPIRSAPPCPYGRKCTYGVKCKYFHPIIKQSVSDSLRKQAALKSTQSLPISSNRQTPISRTRSALPLGNLGTPSHLNPQLQNPHKKLQRQLSINPVSDPRIHNNLQASSSSSSLSSTYLSPFPTQPGLGEVWSPPQPQPVPSYDEDRQRMFFHLAAIFPKHQVSHVMGLYPTENDPQVICKHILQLFG